MGLLDEAIREHLDLKRRRGADPGEVERAEREALGPVRRVQAPEEGEVDELSEPIETADGVAFDHEVQGGDDGWTFEDELSPPRDEEPLPELEPEPSLEAPHDPGSVGQETAVHRPDFLDDEDFEEPDYEPDDAAAPAPHPAQEPAEHPGTHPGSGHGDDGEELLEETPEFLQDTPDHDRLWFEQRPPKDFDFDG
jgi:hypothetical protein